MPYSGKIVTELTGFVESPVTKGGFMDHEIDTDCELVTETLIEEVSIDGMCGVY
jgi:mycofactocin precursor